MEMDAEVQALLNATRWDAEELRCYLGAAEVAAGGAAGSSGGGSGGGTGGGWCPHSWDRLLCWPPTKANTAAVLPCFAELNGIPYDTSQNASRWCHANGTWDGYSNYSLCRDLSQLPAADRVEVATALYYAGYTLSLVALSVAVCIFLYFKDLRCLRNTIHTNLMFTYMLADFMWIVTTTLQVLVQTDASSCVILMLLLHYFHLTNFFWMFVEGLYLYILVVETFTGKNIQLSAYVIIGWGAPAVFVLLWGIVKSFAPRATEQQVHSTESLLRHCPWMSPDSYDWIYQAPAIVVLALNLVFLVMIMWVLITKLRSANTVETQQYRKATKALLVLIPLLGITYILMIAGPTEGFSAEIYLYLRAVLLSTQGFTVALFYCFLNSEVQNTVRHHLERWKTARTVGGSRRYTRNYSRDWSPRSRTESIRLSVQPAVSYRKRESTASETTTTTLLAASAAAAAAANNGGWRLSNGSGRLLQPCSSAEHAV
ncbi:diuretic hormone receptor-like [Schistocerca piceifrons]|uniref:diuretic hormone receptor-like n=1 Tax=Schistocerca piceifrons TaxID=274613 RepID=UPI001F5F5433|nr:diuretic hormone receptor-like [Schistocerca piceifrons]